MSSLNHSANRAVRATSLTAAAVLTLSASALVWSSTASAAAPDIYDMSAEAVALQTTFTDPSVPLGIPFSVGSYGASSILNSNGESSADAGAPYSPLVSSLPNTGNGVAQSTFGTGLPVVPTFPGYVSAKDPVLPSNKQNAGGYELVAERRAGASPPARSASAGSPRPPRRTTPSPSPTAWPARTGSSPRARPGCTR